MKRTIKIFSLPTACGLGGAVRRAALMLLVTLLTTMSAWADDVTYINENGTSFVIRIC